jgi:Zn-dependent peptidase ImmA (M78 family)
MDRITQIAEDLACKFRSEHDCNMREPIIIKTLLAKLRILTMYKSLSKNAYGLSTCSADKKDKFILVNSESSKGRQHFTIAHELYHLYLDENPHPHICRKDGKKDKAEVMADAFASALLLPSDGVMKAIPTEEIKSRNISLATVFSLEQYFRVSHQSVLFRLRRLGLMTEDTLKSMIDIKIRDIAPQYGIFDMSLYKKGNENVILSDYGFRAKYLFDNEKISESHYNQLMSLISDGKKEG